MRSWAVWGWYWACLGPPEAFFGASWGNLGVPNLAVAYNGENGMWSWAVWGGRGMVLGGFRLVLGMLGAILGLRGCLSAKRNK